MGEGLKLYEKCKQIVILLEVRKHKIVEEYFSSLI